MLKIGLNDLDRACGYVTAAAALMLLLLLQHRGDWNHGHEARELPSDCVFANLMSPDRDATLRGGVIESCII